MLERLHALFDRYADRHFTVAMAGGPLSGPTGEMLGHIDRIEIEGSRLLVAGWTTARRITLIVDDRKTSVRPAIPREDVRAALGLPGNVGFEFNQPIRASTRVLELETDAASGSVICPLPAIGAAEMARARHRVARRFARDLLRASPAILHWLLTRDPAARARIKAVLHLTTEQPRCAAMETRLFCQADTAATLPSKPRITIILPVYNAFDLLAEVLDRIVRHTDLPYRLLIVEDCSSDARVRPFLRRCVAAPGSGGAIELIENATNKGFIGSVNSALRLALAYGDHVVLLNSDAFVPAGWATRLIRPMLMHEAIASVTPMSNDAEIFSVPAICTRTPLAAGQGDAIDAVARQFHPEAVLSVAPTGVGFCMAMNIRYLRKVPAFDPAFGRGYGEEVDWCQKTRALGGRHLGLPGLFVAHRGGESFGADEKRALVSANDRIISARYPDYDRQVQDFIANDPLRTARLALSVAWLASSARGPVPIYLGHSLGGGAEKYLERRIAQDIKADAGAVVLRVGSRWRWQLEVHSRAGMSSGATDEFAFVSRLLAPLSHRHIVYSCGVGDPDPIELPTLLLEIYRPGRDRLEVLFHDFFPLSPSYCLLGDDGQFSGAPRTPGQAHQVDTVLRPDGTRVDLALWQARWGRLLRAADDVVVFSRDSARQVQRVHPDIAAHVRHRPHPLLVEVASVSPPPAGSTITIGVLGNIGYQKGAAVLVDLAEALETVADMSCVLIGAIDPAYRLPSGVRVHGAYRVADLPELVARYRIGCWLIPSIWPETFSFTTHEALATGLPVHCFDLGAQGEAARAASNGRVIPLVRGPALIRNIIAAIGGAQGGAR